MSASRSPTRVPARLRASARFVAMGALADASLAAHHQNHVPYVGDWIRAGCFSGRNVDLELQLHKLDAQRH